ncbi:microfibril-associated glycoprotein 4-like [Panulirus ornatus]|uniref:microfibril-associated glycoprotein 4-like n=1 Tax=Panulirus ornatus TaxID=150431 RepID=UPI003A872C41
MADWGKLSASLFVMVAAVAVVSHAEDPAITNIKIGDLASLSINSESQVTVLLLVMGPTGQEGSFNISQMINVTCPVPGDQQVDDATESPVKTSGFRNCQEMQTSGYNVSGTYTIHPYVCCPNISVSVYCDFQSDGGGWTVIQRRDQYPQQEDFFLPWKDYVTGFGKVTQEFWLGLEHIHALTSQEPYEVRFDLEDFDGVTGWAKYDHFEVSGKDLHYRLNLGEYSGDVGNGMKYHNGMSFSTKDRDNDNSTENCAVQWKGGWWYNSCQHVSLNGPYVGPERSPGAEAILWFPWRFFSVLKKTEIKVRPVARQLH